MAQTGRAELLRALHLGAVDAVALEHDDRGWWGYQRQEAAAPPPPAVDDLPDRPPPPTVPPPVIEPTEDPLRQPLQMPLAWVLRQQSSRDLPQELRGLPKVTEADLRPLAPDPLPYRDLVPWARALPGIRRHTDRQVAHVVDWPCLGAMLARQELPRRLPQRQQPRWPQQVVLVLDFSPRLAPYRWDFHRLALRLDAQLPGASLSVRVLQHGPAAPWSAWQHPNKPRRWRDEQPWETYWPPGTVMLLATDLGVFDRVADTRQGWLDWGKALRSQGCRLIALAPVGATQLTDSLLQGFELVRWSADSRWHRERRAPVPQRGVPADGNAAPAEAEEAEPTDPRLDALVALAATALRIDPPLLRAWRSLLPGGGDAGLEGRLWNHPHLLPAGFSCATRSEHLDDDLARLAALPTALRRAAQAVHTAQHAHLRRSLPQGEALRWAAARRPAATPASGVGATTAHDATAIQTDPLGFVKRLLHTLDDAAVAPSAAGRQRLIGAAELILAAASANVRVQDPALFEALDAALARWRGGQMPEAGESGQDRSANAPRVWQLVQQGPDLVLLPATAPHSGQALGTPVSPPQTTAGVWLQSSAGGLWRQLPPADAPTTGVALATLGDGHETLTVTCGHHTWLLAKAQRPRWAVRWRVAEGKLSAAVPAPDGSGWVWFDDPQPGQTQVAASDGRANIGIDVYGAFADLALRAPAADKGRTSDADLTLRLRWVPAGQFLMGSPDGQGEDDEHPQHPVLISQGFWLAQTPCTQALWQAVMGANPSHFKDAPDAAQHPVERVSWFEVQEFLSRLKAWLPSGCVPVLPTEAQWEHAARAGTHTAYPWGDEPDDGRANWNKQHQGTTPLGRFPPNDWGFADMHGNVWEWCADGARDYMNQPERDPRGDTEDLSGRAVRGGSWVFDPGYAGSACRLAWPPDLRSHALGFRLALRSSCPGAGGPPAEPAPGPGGARAGAGRPGGAAMPGAAATPANQRAVESRKRKKGRR